MPEDKRREFVSWGQEYHPGVKRSDGSQCPTCGWDMHETTKELRTRVEAVIGFTTDQPEMTRAWMSEERRIGIIIVECPSCFEKFWYHCTADGYDAMQSICPKWPKSANRK